MQPVSRDNYQRAEIISGLWSYDVVEVSQSELRRNSASADMELQDGTDPKCRNPCCGEPVFA